MTLLLKHQPRALMALGTTLFVVVVAWTLCRGVHAHKCTVVHRQEMSAQEAQESIDERFSLSSQL